LDAKNRRGWERGKKKNVGPKRGVKKEGEKWSEECVDGNGEGKNIEREK